MKAHLEEMNLSSGSEASNHSCINDSVPQAEHRNKELKKGGGKRQRQRGGGFISVSSSPSLPYALLCGPAKHFDKHFITTHPLLPLIRSCKKVKMSCFHMSGADTRVITC